MEDPAYEEDPGPRGYQSPPQAIFSTLFSTGQYPATLLHQGKREGTGRRIWGPRTSHAAANHETPEPHETGVQCVGEGRPGGAADGPQAGRVRRREVFAEEGSAGSMADAPVTAAIESLASFACAGSVRYAGLLASGVS